MPSDVQDKVASVSRDFLDDGCERESDLAVLESVNPVLKSLLWNHLLGRSLAAR